MTIAAGTRLGRYEIRHSLGAGGMGEVYLGWDPDLERDVAIKVLRGDREESPDRVRRFVQEARAASALNHPNVAHVYEVGSENGLRFIAMEVVAGMTLRDRIGREPIPIDDVLSIATQTAAGVAAAHQAGIIHRDIKPENVIVRPDGYVKVLDFGLAKLQSRDQDAETLLRTGSGVMLGTLHYMAPEQFGGADVTAAADVFSIGVVLYEMVTGRRPFEGDNAAAVATAILSKSPSSAAELRADTPPHLAQVIAKALQKDPIQRYPTAGELLEELKQISRETTGRAFELEHERSHPPTRKRWMLAAGALLVAAATIAIAVTVWRSQRIRKASEAITAAERLLREGKFPEAYASASGAAIVLGGDHRVQAVIASSTTRATIESDPPGATVYLQRYRGPAERTRAGMTPLTIETLPRAEYLVTLEKNGFLPVTRLLSAPYPRDFQLPHIPPALKIRLFETARMRAGMVFVEGGRYRLAGWSRATDRQVELSDYFIDRHEVSNREFEAFVGAGGYRKRDLWRYPFEEKGKTLSFDEAMARFRDTTGLTGPRNWIGGAPPPGREKHPVTNVTWYEAAAYATWKGQTLPTVYQWEKAARPSMAGAVGTAFPWGIAIAGCPTAICGAGAGTDVSDRANFRRNGTLPVNSMPFGMSPWGAYHMAGNVAEWCINPMAQGFAARGGGWSNAVYAFGSTASLPAWFASDDLGFRCVDVSGGADQGGFELDTSTEVPDYKPVEDRTFEEIRRRYDYVRSPLQLRVVETVETSGWRRETLQYEVDGKTVPAYLYIPKGFPPPFQVIHFSPSAEVVSGFSPLTASIEGSLAPYIRGGRAVFSVVLEGFTDRPWTTSTAYDPRSQEWVDEVVTRVTELRRGLDVLEMRKDLDMTRIAFLAPSAGASSGVILAGLEPRYRAVIFVGTKISPTEAAHAPAANRINFASRIQGRKMMLQGRYDESAPLATHAEPLFRLLREPKTLEVFEGSHMPQTEVSVPIITKWLDETLSPPGQ